MYQVEFRGRKFDRNAVVAAMKQFDDELRGGFKRWKTYAVRYEGKDYPPKELLRLVAGDVGDFDSTQARHLFRKLGFEIVQSEAETPAPEREAEEAQEVRLSLENDLEEALARDLGQLEPGLHLYKNEGLTGRQVDAQDAGRIDLLAVDAKENLVVIELKAGEADRQVCGQIQAYMGWAKQKLAGGRDVRGIIVAYDVTPKAQLAASVVPGLQLKEYRLRFAFKSVDSQ